jgi:hypothetical protein
MKALDTSCDGGRQIHHLLHVGLLCNHLGEKGMRGAALLGVAPGVELPPPPATAATAGDCVLAPAAVAVFGRK